MKTNMFVDLDRAKLSTLLLRTEILLYSMRNLESWSTVHGYDTDDESVGPLLGKVLVDLGVLASTVVEIAPDRDVALRGSPQGIAAFESLRGFLETVKGSTALLDHRSVKKLDGEPSKTPIVLDSRSDPGVEVWVIPRLGKRISELELIIGFLRQAVEPDSAKPKRGRQKRGPRPDPQRSTSDRRMYEARKGGMSISEIARAYDQGKDEVKHALDRARKKRT